jgi:hypothetical protein
MDLALTFDQYDAQVQVDSLIGRVVGHTFTDGNALTYMRSSDLILEVARSILEARQYHVLWTHEFMGRAWSTRAIDNVGYTVVADAYLPALTAAVRRYDSTGVMPLYMILHDQYFYETSDGRLWLTILEDPLNASMHLKGDDGTRERHLLGGRTNCAAVAASPDCAGRVRRATPSVAAEYRLGARERQNQSDFLPQRVISFRASRSCPTTSCATTASW